MPPSAKSRSPSPDLSEGVWARAWRDAKVRSLGTLFGLLVTTGGAGTGGQLANSAGVVGVVAGGVVGALIGFGEFLAGELFLAARKQRDDLRVYVRDQRERQQALEQFKQRCIDWAATVESFLDSRSALEPPTDTRDVVKRLMRQMTDEQRQRDQEIAWLHRETVSLYIQEHRDSGLRLFDLLIHGGFIVADGRQWMESPKSPTEIWQATDCMREGADRL